MDVDLLSCLIVSLPFHRNLISLFIVHLKEVPLLLQVLQPLHPLQSLARHLLLAPKLSHEVITHLLLVVDFIEQVCKVIIIRSPSRLYIRVFGTFDSFQAIFLSILKIRYAFDG